MKKETYLGKDTEWSRHMRNTVRGKKGYNKLRRTNIKKEDRILTIESQKITKRKI